MEMKLTGLFREGGVLCLFPIVKESSLLLLLAELCLLVVLSLLKSGLGVGRRAVAISNQSFCWFSHSAAEGRYNVHKPSSKATMIAFVVFVTIPTDVCTSL